MKTNKLFDLCVNRSCGGRSIQCKLGLWSVSSASKSRSEREAKRYWQQYYADGEYDSLLTAQLEQIKTNEH